MNSTTTLFDQTEESSKPSFSLHPLHSLHSHLQPQSQSHSHPNPTRIVGGVRRKKANKNKQKPHSPQSHQSHHSHSDAKCCNDNHSPHSHSDQCCNNNDTTSSLLQQQASDTTVSELQTSNPKTSFSSKPQMQQIPRRTSTRSTSTQTTRTSTRNTKVAKKTKATDSKEITCESCLQIKNRNLFSNSQLKKENYVCKECVEGNQAYQTQTMKLKKVLKLNNEEFETFMKQQYELSQNAMNMKQNNPSPSQDVASNGPPTPDNTDLDVEKGEKVVAVEKEGGEKGEEKEVISPQLKHELLSEATKDYEEMLKLKLSEEEEKQFVKEREQYLNNLDESDYNDPDAVNKQLQ